MATRALTQIRFARPQGQPAAVVVLLRLIALPVLGFLCFGVGLAIGVPSNQIALLGLAIATGTLILMVAAVDRALPRERRSLLLSLFSFSYACFFVVPAFVFYIGDRYPLENSPSPIPLTVYDMTRGMLTAFVAYTVLLVGYALPIGKMAADSVPRMRREWSAETTIVVALVALFLGWIVMLAGQFGLLPERAGSGILGTISRGTIFGVGLIALCYQRYRSLAALLLLAVVIPPTMLFNFFTGSKILFLAPLVMVAIVHILVTRRLRAWWIAGFLAVMAAFYPLSMAYREYMFGRGLSAVEVIANPQAALNVMADVTSSSDSLDYLRVGMETTFNRLDGLGILSVIMRDAGTRVPFQRGRSLSYVPIAYVPRLLWPGKPVFQTGQWVTDNFGWGPHIRSSTGCTWMGEFYFNFGWTGILVGMTLLGVWFRFLQEFFLRIDATIPAMLAGMVAILTIATGVGGDMLGPTNTVIFSIAPIVLTHIVVRMTTRTPVRLPQPL